MSSSTDTQTTFSFPSPAKINLCLKIVGREADGYHVLQTVFHFLDINDTLHFTKRNDNEIQVRTQFCFQQENIPDADNLVLRAAKLLRTYAQQHGFNIEGLGVDIELEKKLPLGGGIGGGSSNAASTLLVLNQLWNLGLSLDTLAELGLRLGADVPVFIYGKSAYAEGRGERLTALEIGEFYYILVKPNCHVSTAEIFQHQDLTRDSSPTTIRAFLTRGQSFQGLEKLIEIGNDCEKLVRKLYPTIDKIIDSLSQFSKAQLTGTGACVFAPFETQVLAEHALSVLQSNPANKHWFDQAQVVKGMNTSSLHSVLQQMNWGVAKR